MKNSRIKKNLWMIAALTGSLLFASCNDDVESNGSAKVSVTDATVDAENITGVYLAVSEVQAKSASGISTIAKFDEPRSFNVMAYQNGEVFALGEGELAAGIYNELRLILDEEGSYVAYEDGTTVDMDVPSGTTTGYKVKGDFQIAADNETDLVIDIDLRKALVTSGINEETYKLRPTARLLVSPNTGTITGSVDITAMADDRIVVYAYTEGSYTSDEASDPAEGTSRFEHSVNSAVVAEDGSFTLAFMEEGDYELIFSHYEKNEVENTYEFNSVVDADLMLDGTLLLEDKVEVESDVTTSILIELSL